MLRVTRLVSDNISSQCVADLLLSCRSSIPVFSVMSSTGHIRGSKILQWMGNGPQFRISKTILATEPTAVQAENWSSSIQCVALGLLPRLQAMCQAKVSHLQAARHRPPAHSPVTVKLPHSTHQHSLVLFQARGLRVFPRFQLLPVPRPLCRHLWIPAGVPHTSHLNYHHSVHREVLAYHLVRRQLGNPRRVKSRRPLRTFAPVHQPPWAILRAVIGPNSNWFPVAPASLWLWFWLILSLFKPVSWVLS